MMQKRMHKAFEKYLKQRSLHSQAELDRCQALSEETYQKIKAAEVFGCTHTLKKKKTGL